MKLSIALFTFSAAAAFFSCASGNYSVRPRFLDLYSNEYMVEDINDVLTVNKAAPNCATESDVASSWMDLL